MRASRPPCPPGFDLVRAIGQGASSVVWEATQRSTGRPIALKILDSDVDDPDSARRFDRERAVLAALAVHPGILTVHDAGTHAGRPWLATELCHRGSLATYVAGSGPLDLPTALDVLARLADALGAAHARDLLHCDVKPANVLLTDHGDVVLGDFGIARRALGQTTTTVGFTLDHVAPELLDDEKPSARSDIYSLGTTAFELLAGHPPFRRTADVSIGTVVKRIATQPLPDLPDVPAPVLDLLHRMTAKDPVERTATATAVADRARALVSELELPGGTTFGPLPPTSAGTGDPSTDTDTDTDTDTEYDTTDRGRPRGDTGDDALVDDDLAGLGADAGPLTADATVHRRRPVVEEPAPPPAPPAYPRRRRVLLASTGAAAVLALTAAAAMVHHEVTGQEQVGAVAQSSAATPDRRPESTSATPTPETSTTTPTPTPTPTPTRRHSTAHRTVHRQAPPRPAPAPDPGPSDDDANSDMPVTDDAGTSGTDTSDSDTSTSDTGTGGTGTDDDTSGTAGTGTDDTSGTSDSDSSDTDRVNSNSSDGGTTGTGTDDTSGSRGVGTLDKRQSLNMQQVPVITLAPR